MDFDWADYKTLAEELRLRSDEASKRSAISRVYYSVFHLALQKAPGFQPSQLGDGSHRKMWDTYNGKNRTSTAVATKGNRLRLLRNDADYEDSLPKLDELMNESFIVADNILQYLGQLP